MSEIDNKALYREHIIEKMHDETATYTDSNKDANTKININTILYKTGSKYSYAPKQLQPNQQTVKPVSSEFNMTFAGAPECQEVFWQYYFILGDYLFSYITEIINRQVNLMLANIDLNKGNIDAVLRNAEKTFKLAKTHISSNNLVEFSKKHQKQRDFITDKIDHNAFDIMHFVENIKKSKQ